MRTEHEARLELTKLWQERENAETQRVPSLVEIPRFFVPKSTPLERSQSASEHNDWLRSQQLQAEVGRLARARLRAQTSSLILSPAELDQLWRLLKQHASPPHAPNDERLNYDDFCQVAEGMPGHCAETFFCASHFVKFYPDAHGRISLVDFFQWARRKNSLMQTRAELLSFDSTGDGCLTERDIEQWIDSLIPTLPTLSGIVHEFLPFYKVTAVRKFLFFLDPRKRGRMPIKAILASPVSSRPAHAGRRAGTRTRTQHASGRAPISPCRLSAARAARARAPLPSPATVSARLLPLSGCTGR